MLQHSQLIFLFFFDLNTAVKLFQQERMPKQDGYILKLAITKIFTLFKRCSLFFYFFLYLPQHFKMGALNMTNQEFILKALNQIDGVYDMDWDYE